LTTFAYLVVLPLYVITSARGMVKAGQEQLAYEADAPARALRDATAAIESVTRSLKIGRGRPRLWSTRPEAMRSSRDGLA